MPADDRQAVDVRRQGTDSATVRQSRPRRTSIAASEQARTVLVVRSYVLDQEQDDFAKGYAADTGYTITDVIRLVLDQRLQGLSVDLLRRGGKLPFGAGPPVARARARHRTVSIRVDQDELLKQIRLRAGIQASDVVRQGLDRLAHAGAVRPE